MIVRISSLSLVLLLGLTTTESFAQSAPDPLAVRKAINDSCLGTEGTKCQVEKVELLQIPEGDRIIAARMYRPKTKAEVPILVFIHGGGFVAGNLDTHDNACRYLCERTPCLVFSIDYRLAPEHKFPGQVIDCCTAAVWAAENAARFGGNKDQLAVLGDSGGGTLAAAVCQELRNRKGPRFRAQVLINPALDFSAWDGKAFESYRLFRDYYLKDPKDARRASPLLSENLKGLPPALVIVGEKDALRREGEAYVAKLRDAGVPANAYCQYGQGHLGPMWAAAAPAAQEPLDVTIGFLRAAFRQVE